RLSMSDESSFTHTRLTPRGVPIGVPGLPFPVDTSVPNTGRFPSYATSVCVSRSTSIHRSPNAASTSAGGSQSVARRPPFADPPRPLADAQEAAVAADEHRHRLEAHQRARGERRSARLRVHPRAVHHHPRHGDPVARDLLDLLALEAEGPCRAQVTHGHPEPV